MLLVEDESFERTSLASCVDWGLIGVDIAGEAANGSQGLAKVLELKPDIVLTDVRMPVMDGIEMSRRIRNAAPDVKILFLSSYDDFEYAKQAIDLNVSAYLMKPVNERELLRAVKRAADEINEKALEQRLLSKEQGHLTRRLNLARQTLATRVLSGMGVLEQDTRSLGMDWLMDPGRRFLVVLCVYEPAAMRPIDAKLERLALQVQKACAHSTPVSVNEGQTVVLCGIGQESAEAAAQRVGFALRQFFESEGADVRVAMSAGENAAELYDALLKRNLRAPREAASRKAQSKEDIVGEMRRLIHEGYASALSLESIARQMHFTPNYIGALFKSVTDTSLSHYLLNVRIERSKQMLEEDKQIPLGKIAEACGFGSITYFHTIFKRTVGITPSVYRHRAREARR